MKKSYIFSALLAAGLGFASCSSEFMELDPVGSVSEGTLSDPAGLERMLASAYATFYSMDDHNWDMGVMSMANWMFGDVVGGDSNKGSTASDQPAATELESWVFDQSNDYFNRKFKRSYEGVKRANQVLQLLDKLGDAVQDKAAFEAEAKFIKGVAMFEAIKNFGGAVPYISVEEFIANPDPQVSNHDDNGNYIYVWDKVAEDLKFAAENMKDEYPKEGYGRPNKYAAEALLAKLYMYWSSPYNGGNGAGQNKWAEAKALLEDIIENGKTSEGIKFKLEPNYAKIFSINGDDTSENVFDVEYKIEGTAWQTCTINGSHAPAPQFITGAWGFYQPSYELTNCFRVDDSGLPIMSSNDLPALCTKAGTEAISDLSAAVDPRLDITAGRFEVPYYWDNEKEGWGTPKGTELKTYIREVDNAGLFFNKKYNPASTEAGAINDCPLASNKNLHVIRFAEVLLMAAEVAIHENKFPKALEYINLIRERAANSAWWLINKSNPHVGVANGKVAGEKFAANYKVSVYPEGYMNAGNAMDILEREIRLELGMEGNRWFDLCRWGKAKQTLEAYGKNENKHLGKSKYPGTYNADWVTLPFPNTQVQASEGRFIQNEVWK